MEYVGFFVMFAILVTLLFVSTILIGFRVTLVIWLTAIVFIAVGAYTFFKLSGGAL